MITFADKRAPQICWNRRQKGVNMNIIISLSDIKELGSDLNTRIKNIIKLLLYRRVGGAGEGLCNQKVTDSIFKHPRHLLKRFSD